jgi:hypothetical protein
MNRIRISFDHGEGRRDHRYARPPLTVELGTGHYITADWSLGGFKLLGFDDEVAVGTQLAGTFSIATTGTDGVGFTAEVVRCNSELGEVAFKFLNLSSQAFDALDRTIARRLRGR